jgi:hypothetical protein
MLPGGRSHEVIKIEEYLPIALNEAQSPAAHRLLSLET